MDQLRRKVGPFEVWQWLLIVVVGIGIGILVRRRLGSGSSSSGTGGGESGGGGGTQTVGASPGYSGVGGGGGMGPQPAPGGDASSPNGKSPSAGDGQDEGRSPVLRDGTQLGIGGDAGGARTKPVRLPENPEPSNVRPIRDPIRSGPGLVAIEVRRGPFVTRYSLDPESGQYLAPSGARYVAELHRGKAIRHIYA